MPYEDGTFDEQEEAPYRERLIKFLQSEGLTYIQARTLLNYTMRYLQNNYQETKKLFKPSPHLPYERTIKSD